MGVFSDRLLVYECSTDITGAVNPPFLSILRAGTLPSPSANPALNSDTCWVNLALVYQSLPLALQQRIEELNGLHDLYELVSEHPLVTRHPVLLI